MSQMIVEVCEIAEVQPHPNADKLELAVVKGFQSVVAKGLWKKGDVIIYIPYDALVPVELSDKYNFTQYLKSGGRVKPTALRKEMSYGIIIPNFINAALGENVAEKLGIKKYIPEVRTAGNGKSRSKAEHPLFPRYTDVENLRHYPNAFRPLEMVVVTEKLHGTNVRVGVIDEEFVAGSRRLQLEIPEVPKPIHPVKKFFYKLIGKALPTEIDMAAMAKVWHTFPLTLTPVLQMLVSLSTAYKRVILYGEVFGGNIQKGVRYGTPDQIAFRAFDLMLDGEYVDYDIFESYCAKFGVPMVPLLYRGQYTIEGIKELSKGKTVVGEDTHIREGVVVRPTAERRDPKVGRLVLKYVSDDYLLSKDIGDFEDE